MRAAKRFLGKALNGLKDWEKPTVINTDKAPAYGIAIAQLKAESKCPVELVHRQVKYLTRRSLIFPLSSQWKYRVHSQWQSTP